jgi:predicted nuclease with TOPRIM domain
MHRTIEDNNLLNEEIYKKALVIERLQAQRDDLEYGNILKISELQRLKKDLSRIEENQDGLSNRNTALREKFNQLDSNVRIEGDKISEEMRNFFKKLGLKVVQETAPDNLVELKIQFSENHDYNATFIYDSVTEDYDRKFKNLVMK